MAYMTNDRRVNRIYSNFRGVDFRGLEVNLLRSPDALNVWKDYRETDSIRTRPALEMVSGMPVNGIFFNGDTMIFGSNDLLYAWQKDDTLPREMFRGSLERTNYGFMYDGIFYFSDGLHIYYYDGEFCQPVIGYVPTTTIARKPMGGGTKHEDVNILSDYRKNSFLSDGVSFTYFLDVMNIDTDFVPEVSVTNKTVYYEVETINLGGDIFYRKTENKLTIPPEITLEPTNMKTEDGEVIYGDMGTYLCVRGIAKDVNDTIVPPAEYTVNYEEGSVTFKWSPPDPPLTDGQDNVIIKFKKVVKDKDGNPAYHGLIEKCTLFQVFDNRVFFSGNPDYPNMVWHSSLSDVSYVSDLDYYKEGNDSAAVKGMIAGNNALWVFREPSATNATVFYHTPALDEEYGKVYPSSHSTISTGCVGKAINFNDDLVFFSERGMEGISGDITTEQVIAHRSSLVDRKLLAEPNYKDMVLAEWESYLLVFVGKNVYLADSRARFTNEDHLEYEWFMWELEHEVTCAAVNNGVLYIGTNEGLYKLTDKTSNVESYWTTALDKFKNPHKLKTTNKRGCVAEATGDIAVYAKLEDTDFELIGEYKNVTDYFVSRIKRKKFKDIQLKFHSNTRFSLETVTLEAFIGGYIKR